MRSLIEPVVIPIVEFAARSYTAGSRIEDAIGLAMAMRDLGYASTLCYWNGSGEDPDVVHDHYAALLDRIRDTRLDSYLAVKIPALWERYDLTARIVERGRAQGTRIVFDSHAPAQADTTFAFLDRLGGEGLGCAIPGRWRRSPDDAERAAATGAGIRVVKGQWVDPDAPDIDLRRGYLDVVDRLTASGCSAVGVATHDPVLAREAIRRLTDAGTPCEQELVFPLPIDAARAEAARAGLPSRIYIPFGKSWLPYSLSRAARRPIIFYWLLRDLVLNKRFKLPKGTAHASPR